MDSAREMDIAKYDFRVEFGQQKARNDREVDALLKAVQANGVIVRSLLVTVDSLHGLESEEKLLGSPLLSSLESLGLSLDFSLGAQCLGILAEVAEAGRISSSLRSLNIFFESHDFALPPHGSSSSTLPSSRTSSSLGLLSSRSGSAISSFYRSRTSSSQNSNSAQAAALASWEGFGLLARALRNNKLPLLEKPVSLNTNWSSKNLADDGAKYLAELIESGYLMSWKELDLENNSIGTSGMEALARALRDGNLPALEKLNLNRNNFETSVVGVLEVLRLVEADRLPDLKWIGLFGAGRQTTGSRLSIAEEIVAIFSRNTALTAVVEIDWPDKRLQGRWNLARERNLKVTRILERLGSQEEVPVSNGKIFICGFPGVGKTTLRKSLKRSRFGAFTCSELRPHRERPTRGIEVTKIKDQAGRRNRKITLTLWDLAGQEDFQVLHSSFLPDLGMANGKATTFVVVFNAMYNRLSNESASAEEEMVYWLRFIASNSIIGVRRKVVVVLNSFNGTFCPEKAQWIELLNSLHEKYQDVLDINMNPFVLDARAAKSVRPLKGELFRHTRNVLEGLCWPKICQYIQENLEGWSLENQKFPIVHWYDFVGKMAASKLAPEKLEAAVEYLHETGDLIYFRKGSLVEGESPDAKLIVLDPQWFCKRVVGQLLLPEGMLDAGETALKRSVAPNGSLGIREIKAYFKELLTSAPQVDYVLSMLFRLGLCYKVGRDKVLIPALIEEDELPAKLWGRLTGQSSRHWIMGRSLALKDTERTTLPKAVFRRLQVLLAQDPELGGLANSGYLVGKSFLTFKKSGILVLAQFDVNEQDPRDDRIDVITRSLGTREKDPVGYRNEQIDLVEKIMARLLELCLVWCPGISFVENVILPWSASEGAIHMLERNAKVSVEEIKLWMQNNGLRADLDYSDLNWAVGEETVKEYELLSSSEMQELQKLAEAKADALKQLVVDLEIIPVQPVLDSTETPEKTVSNAAGLEKTNKGRSSGVKRPVALLHHKIEREAQEIRNHINQTSLESRRHIDKRFDDVADKTSELQDSLRRAFESQKMVLRKLQDIERLSVEELESSVPQFMYLTDSKRSSVWLTLQQAVVERTSTLHLMCEARYKDGLLHEVEGQKGVEISKLKDWAAMVAPWFERSIKVAIVAAKIVGGVLLPGLNLLIPHVLSADGKLLSVMVANGVLSLNLPSTQDTTSTIDGWAEKQTMYSDADGGGFPSSAADVKARAKFVLRKLLGDPLGQRIFKHFGLTRVILTDSHDFTRTSVVWMCQPCAKSYGKLARDIS